MEQRFFLSDTQAELLLHFEQKPNLESLSESMNRDMTVISKQLKKISEKSGLLVKVSGRWKLTDSGKRFNQTTRDYLFSQQLLIQKQSSLRVGTNREFASRVIAVDIEKFKQAFSSHHLSFVTLESGVEDALLKGEIDIGFDCGRPQSPEIAYSQVVHETISAVASPAFIKKHGTSELEVLPHIFCERLKADRVSNGKLRASNIAMRTNDIATARQLCLSGQGWALLPQYCIFPELASKQLQVCNGFSFKIEKYGVWKLRNRRHLNETFEQAQKWLSLVKL